jgi:Ca2+/Na+ antiporter
MEVRADAGRALRGPPLLVQPPQPLPPIGPFVWSISLGALFGASALTFFCFVAIGSLFSTILNVDNLIVSLSFTEVLAVLGVVAGIVLAVVRRRSVGAGALLGASGGLFAGTACSLLVILAFNGNIK